MSNPILQAIGHRKDSQMSQLSNMVSMINGNPDGYFQQMMQTNPQFAKFVKENQGKTPEQIAQENGVDLSMVRNLLGR